MKYPIAKGLIEIWKKDQKEFFVQSSGKSMLPLIKPGSVLKIRCTDEKDIKIGDIVVFLTDEDSLVSHRVIGRVSRDGKIFFKEKGDNIFKVIERPVNTIVGKVIGIKEQNKEIDLTTNMWRFFNLFLGYSWAIFFKFLEIAITLKKRLRIKVHFSHILLSKVYRIISLLLLTGTKVFKLMNLLKKDAKRA